MNASAPANPRSLSLEGVDGDTIAAYTQRFGARHKPRLPQGPTKFTGPPMAKLVDAASEIPVQVATEPRPVLMWFAEDGSKIRFEISATAAEAAGDDAFMKWASDIYGPGGTLANSVVDNFNAFGESPRRRGCAAGALWAIAQRSQSRPRSGRPRSGCADGCAAAAPRLRRGATVGKTKIAGVSAKKVAEAVERDLQCGAGQKPQFLCQMVKPREDMVPDTDDVVPTRKFVFTVYLSDRNGTRDDDGTPPEIAAAFAGKMDHPIVQYFQNNPGVKPKPPNLTVANGSANPWEILAACSHRSSKSGYYGKALASLTLGGLGFRFNAERKIFVGSAYLNGPGCRVYAVPAMGRGVETVVDDEDTAIYNAVTKRPLPTDDDDDIYKKARLDEE